MSNTLQKGTKQKWRRQRTSQPWHPSLGSQIWSPPAKRTWQCALSRQSHTPASTEIETKRNTGTLGNIFTEKGIKHQQLCSFNVKAAHKNWKTRSWEVGQTLFSLWLTVSIIHEGRWVCKHATNAFEILRCACWKEKERILEHMWAWERERVSSMCVNVGACL